MADVQRQPRGVRRLQPAAGVRSQWRRQARLYRSERLQPDQAVHVPRARVPSGGGPGGEGQCPDSATHRASITPRPSDAGEEDENDGDGGDGNNGGSNNNKKKKGKKKQNPLGLVVDGEEAARLQKRVETEKADVCYILVSIPPVNYRKLVQGLLCPYAMWQTIEGHFGTRDPTDYASSYTGVFRYRLEDAEDPEMFVQTLDSNVITFERAIDTKLSDLFKSMILQHALPTSWEYIVRGWLGQAKTLSYIKLMELVSSELKRRRPDGSGQDKG
ncbi:unnamed protein product [Phytophthora fragariaefolia]|uniref:Unnamed protein product n=1 Tax=Phytophthora fragariaefolia TaxID=1490495 RepID=A0A9W6YBF9_9STRA|nr:unnamed protein product [Phytophthora fragariaefolia]